MEGNPHSTAPRSPSGGLIRLQAHLTDWVAWVGPAWAAVCGLIASGSFGWQGEDWLRLAVLILIVDAGWGTLWAAMGSTDWAKPLRRWRNWRFGEPSAMPPYTLPGSPGDQMSRWLGQLRAWWRDIFWPTCGHTLSAIAIALPVTVILATLLGMELLLLSAAALSVIQLAALVMNRARQGAGDVVVSKWDAIVAVMLPWLAGHLTYGPLTLRSVGLALAFALAWGATWRAYSRWERVLVIGPQFLAAALLVALHNPLAAGCLLLVLTPQVALLPWLRRGQPISWYVRHTRPWLMGAMLVAAWAVRAL